jgi:hypothetical protein
LLASIAPKIPSSWFVRVIGKGKLSALNVVRLIYRKSFLYLQPVLLKLDLLIYLPVQGCPAIAVSARWITN